MSRIAISCFILVICVYGCIAFTLDVVDHPEQGQSEIGTRHKRKSLCLSLGLAECAHVGSTCLIERDRTENPTKVTIRACCEHLVCAGFGPTERRNGLGQAHSSSDTQSTGICSLSLDNDGASKDHDTYVEYVKGL